MKHCAYRRLLFAALLCTCARDLVNNPYDPDYVGDYSVDVQWPAPSFNAEAFTAYRLPYVTGGDQFDKVTVRTDPAGLVDSGLFTAEITPDSLTLYFNSVFEGMVYVTGRTPNARLFADSCEVRVANPFSVRGDSVLSMEDTVSVRVARDGGFGAQVPEVIWEAGAAADTLYANEPWRILPTAIGDMSVAATMRDWRGNLLALDAFAITVVGRTPRILSAAFVGDTFAMDDTVKARVVVDDADGGMLAVRFSAPEFEWEDSAVFDSEDDKPDTVYFEKFVTDTGVLDARVWCADTTGLSCSASVEPARVGREEHYYEIQWVDMPSHIIVNRPVSFEVEAGPPERIARYEPRIEWRVLADGGADTLLDSAAARLDKISITADDSTDVVVSARVVDSCGRISTTVEAGYNVRLYRPWCDFSSVPGTVGNFRPESLVVEWGDSAGDVVAARLTVTHGDMTVIDTSLEESGAAFVFSFADSGRYEAAAWVKDSDSLCSDTARASVRVLEYRPRVGGVTAEPSTVYRGDWVTLCAGVQRSESDAPVTRVLWDFDGDTSAWDVDTLGTCIRHAFADTGLNGYIVACEDSAGMRSPPLGGSVRALDDRPVIEQFVHTTVWFNDDTAFSVSARDPNGVLSEIEVDWGDGTPASTRSVSDSAVLAQFTHKYSSWGDRTVTVTVVDDDGLSESETFEVNVKKGQPAVEIVEYDNSQRIAGDTLYTEVDSTNHGGGMISFSGVLKAAFRDPNGPDTTHKYYWDYHESDGLDTVNIEYPGGDTTHTDTVRFVSDPVAPIINCDDTRQWAVFAQDDDGLMAGDTFWIHIECVE
ncbi:MAG: hypothetical protein GF418_02685 [Chitinivibrionales bacterium]|nr:hypothetical protein [Chitinivibrionales bacterium]MBD3394508.1 hypothetical protein [Chitinivibrionales bacterium]